MATLQKRASAGKSEEGPMARFQEYLSSRSLRMTPERRSVLESVPFTPAAIAGKACEQNPSMEHCDSIDNLEEEGMPVPPEAKCHE